MGAEEGIVRSPAFRRRSARLVPENGASRETLETTLDGRLHPRIDADFRRFLNKSPSVLDGHLVHLSSQKPRIL